MSSTNENEDQPAIRNDTLVIGTIPTARRIFDRIATSGVTGGGVAIILAIFGILAFLLAEVLPLWSKAEIDVGTRLRWAGEPPAALLCDEYRTLLATLSADGALRLVRFSSGEVEAEANLFPPSEDADEAARRLVHVSRLGRSSLLAGSTEDGHVLIRGVDWEIEFDDEGRRSINGSFGVVIDFEFDPDGKPVRTYSVAPGEGEGAAIELSGAAQLADGRIVLVRRTAEENLFTEEVEETIERVEGPTAPPLRFLATGADGSRYFAVGEDDALYWWIADGRTLGETQRVARPADAPSITAAHLLHGGRSLAVGTETGSIEIWSTARGEGSALRFVEMHSFPATGSAARTIAVSPRNRTFAVVDADSELHLHHSTAERGVWTGAAPVSPVTALSFAPKSDGICVASPGELVLLDIDNPHPETSASALFGEVWYENYPEPDHVWQSTGGVDTFEPKLSLTPLLFGTLKGTIYSLLLAIPLGVLGALYTSQFIGRRLQRVVKPTVEIMAALPTVILGFLAGLWLAPRMEQYFPVLLVLVVLLPTLTLLAGRYWEKIVHRYRLFSLPDGFDVLVFAVVITAAVGLSLLLGPVLEGLVFRGDFRTWLFEVTGLRYDQRNAIVVGLAMGFAVIPIVFTISEEAFSSVPRNLISGSLALGASRWQTVARVVLPAASPGVFAAIMVGFGRAVGETMIVLMATGNTPTMDWSPFNGFRTLSANIAVEIPEAPHGGTLYRTLFLSALLLFGVTFAVNTIAEVVRVRLRKRFSQF